MHAQVVRLLDDPRAVVLAVCHGDPVLGNVLPSSSREILALGPDATELRDAARRLNDDFRALVR